MGKNSRSAWLLSFHRSIMNCTSSSKVHNVFQESFTMSFKNLGYSYYWSFLTPCSWDRGNTKHRGNPSGREQTLWSMDPCRIRKQTLQNFIPTNLCQSPFEEVIICLEKEKFISTVLLCSKNPHSDGRFYTFNPAEIQLEAAFSCASSDKIPHVHLKPILFVNKKLLKTKRTANNGICKLGKRKRENTGRATSENFLKVEVPLLQG